MPRTRTILHVDLDAFYASVEERDDPTLRGKPLVVGGESGRGVVCAASYAARKFGVRSAMPMHRARQLCPQAIVISPRMGHYGEVSHQFFDILRRYSPLVEGLSLDEAFLDVTGEERLFGDGATIGRRIKADVRTELELVASVGVAPSKHAAKIASDLEKPDGLVVVPPGEEVAFLAPLPVERLWGVGPKASDTLRTAGVRSIGDVARATETFLASRVGLETARHLRRLALGLDEREVLPDRAAVSVGHEETFERDLHDVAALVPHVLGQADRTCARMRRAGLRGRTITVKVKYGDHQLVTRQTQVPRVTADSRVVGREAVALLDKVPEIARRGVRLTGVSVSGLVDADGRIQLGFDEAEAKRGEALGQALDAIADKFGGGSVKRAVLLDEE